MNHLLSILSMALIAISGVLICGCTEPDNGTNMEVGGIDLDVRSNNEHDDEDLVKSWTITAFVATANKGLTDITWKIRDEGTNQYIFQGTAPLVMEDEAPSSPGIVIYDKWGDGFGSSDRIIARLPDYGNYYLFITHGNRNLHDTQFWITDSTPDDKGDENGGDDDDDETPPPPNVISIEITNKMEYDVEVEVKIGEDPYDTFMATANRTTNSKIEGFDGVTVWFYYTVIGTDEITLERDGFSDVNNFIMVDLQEDGKGSNLCN